MIKGATELLESIMWIQPDAQRTHGRKVAEYAEILFFFKLINTISSHHAFRFVKAWDYIRFAFVCHDIGKFKALVPDWRPSTFTAKLNTQEQHPQRGAAILTELFGEEDNSPIMYDFYRATLDTALSHHERWDGSGYPFGLKGDEIPFIGRVCAIVNEYDILTAPMLAGSQFTLSHKQACDAIISQSGTAFDPYLTDVFQQCSDKFSEHLNNINKTNSSETLKNLRKRIMI